MDKDIPDTTDVKTDDRMMDPRIQDDLERLRAKMESMPDTEAYKELREMYQKLINVLLKQPKPITRLRLYSTFGRGRIG